MTRSSIGSSTKGWYIFPLLLIISFCIGAIFWPYTINTWLLFLGKDPVFRWWYGGLLSFVPGFNFLTIFAAVLTWILMMFL